MDNNGTSILHGSLEGADSQGGGHLSDADRGLMNAFLADDIIGDYDTPAVHWRNPAFEPPTGKLIAVKTPHGIFLHPMMDKNGVRLSWEKQQERWTDGAFHYADVMAWVRLQ